MALRSACVKVFFVSVFGVVFVDCFADCLAVFGVVLLFLFVIVVCSFLSCVSVF